MSDELQEFLSGGPEEGEAFAEGGSSAGSSGGARQAGPPPPTPEPSVPAETAEDETGRDAAGADAVDEASSAAAPRAVITVEQGATPTEVVFDIEFDPPYKPDDPLPVHTVAVGLLDLASRYLGEVLEITVD